MTAIKNRLLRLGVTAVNALMWGQITYQKEAHRAVMQLPKGFPVLSLRAWRDQLVPPSSIEKVFAPATQIHLTRVALTESGHLQGLKENASDYKQGVQQFLSQMASPL